MKILIMIQTPAQVHFWKNIKKRLETLGHQTLLLYRDRGETIKLAQSLKLNGIIYTRTRGTGLSKIISFPLDVLRGYLIARRWKPDLVVDFGIYGAFTAKLLKKPCLIFTDSEPNLKFIYKIQYLLFLPLIHLIITPTSFRDNLGKKQRRINSFKELSYLHPENFIPNSDIRKILGIDEKDRYVLLRFNDLAGVHDLGLKGFDLNAKIQLVSAIERLGIRVFISFEGVKQPELVKYSAMFPKNRIHDVLYYADLLVTDTQTMATEAALLGTPVVRCNTFVGQKDMGNFIELEENGLLYNYRDSNQAMTRILNLLKQPRLKETWREKTEKYIAGKQNIAEYMTDVILTFQR
jgi:predicted glycosyltransferase